jgi:MFS family permease
MPETRFPAAHVKKPKLAAAASFVGSTLEYYDFFIYGAASALVFGKLFFPSLNPALGTLASLGTFAIGYLGRPIGAAVIGHFGDKVGRKQMLVLTLIGMGVCTFLIGCLPTYETIGIAAPILLLVLRLAQGLAVSGESGGATTLSLEHAPENKRAFYASWVNQGAAAGSTIASLAFLGFSSLPTDAFLSWGWRIPFLLSAVVVLVGVIIRTRLPESPEFQHVEDQRAVAKMPFVTVITKQWKSMLRVIGLAVLSVIVPINQVFALSYGVTAGIARPTMITIGLVGSALSIGTQPLFAVLADRIGRKPVFITGGLIAAAATFLFFAGLSNASTPVALIGSVLMMSIGYAACNSVTPALYAEMFDTRVRYTGVAVSGQLGQIFPGFAPAIAAAIIAAGGGGTQVSLFVAICCAFSILVILTARETKNVSTDKLGGLRSGITGGQDVADEISNEAAKVAR